MRPIRVLVIDDSAYNRRTIIKILEEVPEIEPVGYAVDGEDGLRKAMDLKPDLITLDLEMPRMDGFTFLRILMQSQPTPVIVVSGRSEDENVFHALDLGAVEFVAKPSRQISPELFSIREYLLQKIRDVAQTNVSRIVSNRRDAPSPICAEAATPFRKGPRKCAHVVIGASTGGPQALQTILSAIQDPVSIAFAVSQHMPSGFTKAFAERLNRLTGLEVKEAVSGDLMAPGRVLISPGGKNLLFRRIGERVIAEVADPDAGQMYTPSVDAMFDSAATVFGADLLGVVLTGMGNDGAQGIVSIKEQGGRTLAESEETCVVYGMPRESVSTGKVDQVVPLDFLCREILRCCGLDSVPERPKRTWI